MNKLKRICAISAVIFTAIGLTEAAIFNVPTDYPTIQAAIDVSDNGDQIIIADGTYTGVGNRDIDFLGKAITLRSENGPDTCIIDLEGNLFDPDNPHNGFHFHSGEDEASVLDGFTIANAVNKDIYASYGAGVWCENDSGPTIINCIISGNKAWDGGGIYGSKGPITNCTIGDNVAYFWGGGGLAYCDGPITNCNISNNFVFAYGGGLWDCDGPITNCTIIDNVSGTIGGGLCDCDGPITNCTISNNEGWDEGGGLYNCDGLISDSTISGNSTRLVLGGEYIGGGLSYCDGLITGCIISGNSAAVAGGLWYCSGPIVDCIISNNYAFVSDGGLSVCGPVANCIINGNFAEWGRAAVCCSGPLINCTIVDNESGWDEEPWLDSCSVTNCIIWGNICPGSPLWDSVTITYSCIQDWTAGGEGNILDDPLFVDAASEDFHLLPGSPCIDAGTNIPVGGFPATDIEGNPRPQDGDGDGLAMADMGAYEADEQPVDSDGDGVPDEQDAFPNDPGEWADNDEDGIGDNADTEDDNDGMSDTDEFTAGTDPLNSDTDGDGLLDGTEVDMANGTGCPDPLNPDSDGDTIWDGAEVDAGTMPCDIDSDDDGIPDNIDPYPLDPGGTDSFVEEVLRDTAEFTQDISLILFTGSNENANKGRRDAFTNRINAAANEIADGNTQEAIDILYSILDRIDSVEIPKDWITDSAEKEELVTTVLEMIVLLEFLL